MKVPKSFSNKPPFAQANTTSPASENKYLFIPKEVRPMVEESDRQKEQQQAAFEEQRFLEKANMEKSYFANQAEIDKKASGKQKLKDLGLDDDEIKALIGA